MSGYESGKFKPGDRLSTGETFIGETEDGSPLWAEPVTAPARLVDEALDTLDLAVKGIDTHWVGFPEISSSLATVRAEIERLREERDSWKRIAREHETALSERLQEERDSWKRIAREHETALSERRPL